MEHFPRKGRSTMSRLRTIAAVALLMLPALGCGSETSARSRPEYYEVREYRDGALETITRIEDGATITIGPIDCQCSESDRLRLATGTLDQ